MFAAENAAASGQAPEGIAPKGTSLEGGCVFLVTLDGLRWQELFGGAEEALIHKDYGGVRDVPATRARFWRETAEERRAALLPFFWKTIAAKGQVFGDPSRNCVARVTNGKNFSYPGYNEILTGAADPRIDSNDKVDNANVTVLEWLSGRPGFAGRVCAFASWDAFPWIINARRSGLHVDAGWREPDPGAESDAALQELAREVPRVFPDVRYDIFTSRALERYVRRHKPRVVYVSFGETDDWAHAGRYDLYLDAAWRTDRYIERLWNEAQSDPAYKGRTSLVITTDHGRGDGLVEWRNHGKDRPESQFIWMAVLGPATPALGLRENLDVAQNQVAATVARLAGEDYNAAVAGVGQPLPGAVQ